MMDASTRLYARLGEIPEDPNDPESLDDLIVCAFGAFERYYLCWKTKSGEFRQDGYDLPPALGDWLNPTDGTTRDWASLQVVFGRGEEYFASDKNGKLEFKEPEVKKAAEDEEKEKGDKQIRRRSRTVSFLRPLSQTSIRSEGATFEAPTLARRISSISSQRASRPPSLSYSATGSETSTAPSIPQPQDTVVVSEPTLVSRLASLSSNGVSSTATLPTTTIENNSSSPASANGSTPTMTSSSSSRTSTSSNNQAQPSKTRSAITSIPEERSTQRSSKNPTPESCTCGCHDPPLPPIRRPTYANASVQTDYALPSPRVTLRVDTHSAFRWSKTNHSAVSRDVQTPVFENGIPGNPIIMGQMTSFFSKPGYQLGDSLSTGYHFYEQPVYQYQDEFGEEALR